MFDIFFFLYNVMNVVVFFFCSKWFDMFVWFELIFKCNWVVVFFKKINISVEVCLDFDEDILIVVRMVSKLF